MDVNDRVKAGQVLAELDTAKLRDQIERSRASLASAQARVAQAAATATEMQRKLERQRGIERPPSERALDTGADDAKAKAFATSARVIVETGQSREGGV